MEISKIIGIVLIVASLAIGYFGINKIINNEASIKVLNMDLDVSNESGKKQGYLYVGAAILLFGGGLYTLGKRK